MDVYIGENVFSSFPDLEYGRGKQNALARGSFISYVEGHYIQLFLLLMVRRQFRMYNSSTLKTKISMHIIYHKSICINYIHIFLYSGMVATKM